jgi:hypothetical protein
MTVAAPSLTFPGSRTLGSWWRQLASFRPRSLWVAHLLLHRVEAPVRLTRSVPLDRFTRLVLETLTVDPAPTLSRMTDRLPLDPAVLRRVLRGLEIEGLARCDAVGSWHLTDLGRHARQHGQYFQSGAERRSFFFLDSGSLGRSPFLLNPSPTAVQPWPAPDGWAFDPCVLKACLLRPAEWKLRHGFPTEVEGVLDCEDPVAVSSAPGGEEAGLSSWQRIILDEPQRMLAALAITPGGPGSEALFGFEVQAKGWSLNPTPVFEIAAPWDELFPEISADPLPESGRQAWRAWGQANGLGKGEADAATLERRDHRLRVRIPRALLDRLRAHRPEAFKGEAWVLAGGERFREAALLEIKEGT